MGGLFSKKKSPPPKSRVTEQDKAVLQLKQQRDKLRQYQNKIEAKIEHERQVARELLKQGKKDKALLLLRKKKYQEGLIVKTDGQLDNIERLVQDIEFAQIETKVVEGLKSGNEALKKMHELLTLEDVEKIMDETQEGIEYQQEIDELLGGKLSDEDEDALAVELDNILGVTDNDINLPTVPDVEPLSDVPSAELEDQAKKVKTKQRTEAMLAS